METEPELSGYVIKPDADIFRLLTNNITLRELTQAVSNRTITKPRLDIDSTDNFHKKNYFSYLEKFLENHKELTLAGMLTSLATFGAYKKQAIEENKSNGEKISLAFNALRLLAFTLPPQEKALAEYPTIDMARTIGDFCEKLAMEGTSYDTLHSNEKEFAKKILEELKKAQGRSSLDWLCKFRRQELPYGLDEEFENIDILAKKSYFQNNYQNNATLVGTILMSEGLKWNDCKDKLPDYRPMLKVHITADKGIEVINALERHFAPTKSLAAAEITYSPKANINSKPRERTMQLLRQKPPVRSTARLCEELAGKSNNPYLKSVSLFDETINVENENLLEIFSDSLAFNAAKKRWLSSIDSSDSSLVKNCAAALNYIHRTCFDVALVTEMKSLYPSDLNMPSCALYVADFLEERGIVHTTLKGDHREVGRQFMDMVRDNSSRPNIGVLLKVRKQLGRHELDDDAEMMLPPLKKRTSKDSYRETEIGLIATFFMDQKSIRYEDYKKAPQEYERTLREALGQFTDFARTNTFDHLEKELPILDEKRRRDREAALTKKKPSAFIDTLLYALHDKVKETIAPPDGEDNIARGVSGEHITFGALCRALGLNLEEPTADELFAHLANLRNQPIDQLSNEIRTARTTQEIVDLIAQTPLTKADGLALVPPLVEAANKFKLREKNFNALTPLLYRPVITEGSVAQVSEHLEAEFSEDDEERLRRDVQQGKKRAHADVEGDEDKITLAVLRTFFGHDRDWRQPTAEWVDQEDGSRLLTFYQEAVDGERIHIFDDNAPLQISEDQVNELGVNPQRFTKRARFISPSGSDIHMEDTADDDIPVAIKQEFEDDGAISSAAMITDPAVHSTLLDESAQRYMLSWKIPLIEEIEGAYQESAIIESMEISNEPSPNFLWPIRDPLRPSRIHPDYAADEEGLVLHENCECREVFIHFDERKKIVAAYEETRQEEKALSGGVEADKRERMLASYVDVKNEVAQFFGGINEERMRIFESYVKAKKDLEKFCTGIYIEEGREKIAEYERAHSYRSEIDAHVAPSKRTEIETAHKKAKANLALFLAGGIDRHEREALLELYAEARRDPKRFFSGMDAGEWKGLMARYEHNERMLRSYAEVEKDGERLFTATSADEKKNLLAAHVKAKTQLKQFFAEIDPHEWKCLLALYAEVKQNGEGFFPGADATEKSDLSKMYSKKERLLAAYVKADAKLESLFTDKNAIRGETMLKRHKEAEARLDEYFTEREEKIKEIWDYAKEGKAAPAARLFHTPRLTDQTTRSKKLVGEFGRHLLDHNNQPLLEVVDAWVYVKIHAKDFKAIEAFVDKYGKDRFENYAMRGSEDNEGNSYYFVPVRTGHPSALMNDEYPPVDKDGKIVPGKQRGDMMSFEAEIGLTNKFRKADGMQSPHTLQHRLTEAPYETTMGYTYTLKRVDEYWLDRHDADALDSRKNFNDFHVEAGRRLCGRSLMVDWRKKSGQRTNEAFLRDVINNCKEVMLEQRVDGRNPKLVEGEWNKGEFKVWENWHIKGFKTAIAERPVTVFLSFNDRMGSRIDDIRILEEQTPTRESYQAMFNEMRSKAVVRLCQETLCLPGFSLAPSPQVKQEPLANEAGMQQGNVATIPMRSAASTSQPQAPGTASSSRQTKGKDVPGRRGRQK